MLSVKMQIWCRGWEPLTQGGLGPKLCLILCDPMDYTVPEILQARILEWVAIPFSRGSSQPRDQTRSPALQVDSLLSKQPEKPINT